MLIQMASRYGCFSSISMDDTRAQLASGQVSSAMLVDRGLQRIKETDDELRAWVHVADPSRLALQAAASDDRRRAGQARSALDGFPFSVKDSQHVGGLPTAFGSNAALPVIAEQSSPLIARLEAAGAIALGKTSLPEFSWKATTESPRTGITRNPRYPRFSPGGSSGGAAVSIAQGACLLATGTDAAGSVRIPAAFTGTAGFKPSDSIALATTAVEGFKRIGHWGLHANTVADVRVAWSALYGTGTPPHRLRWATIDDSTRLGVRARQFHYENEARMVELFGQASAIARPDWQAAASAIHDLYLRGCYETFERIDPLRRDLIDPGLVAFAKRGALVDSERLARAIDVQEAVRSKLDALFDSVDILILPTIAFDPPLIGDECPEEADAIDWLDWAHCTYLTNLSGHPSVSLPGELDGVPFGLQIIGPRGADAELLAIGAQIEAQFLVFSRT